MDCSQIVVSAYGPAATVVFTHDQSLPATGGSSTGGLLIGVGLLAIGGIALRASRRRSGNDDVA